MPDPDSEAMRELERLERKIADDDPEAPKDHARDSHPAEEPAKQGPGVI